MVLYRWIWAIIGKRHYNNYRKFILKTKLDWKELLIEKTNLSRDFFENNIQLIKTKTNKLCYGKIFINDSTGNLTLSANAEYENENNSYIEGHIDLISGKKVVNDQPCWLFK